MLKYKIEVLNLKGLNKHIDYVNKMLNMKTDKSFQRFIQEKCWNTLQEVMNERLIGGTTNDDQIELYKNSNHIVEDKEGFIIYNDAKIPADYYNILPFDTSSYPSGMFSIALAFEYGVGIIGENTNNPNAWQYNLGDYNFGWYLPKNVYGKSGISTAGYMGFEIYRFTADRIKMRLSKWVNEYYSEVLK